LLRRSFSLTAPAPTDTSTLSLHDALPILEGIAHRGDFDLRSHMEGKLVRQGDQLAVELGPDGKPRHRGSGKDLHYFDEVTREKRSEEHTSELQSLTNLVCRLLLEKKKNTH